MSPLQLRPWSVLCVDSEGIGVFNITFITEKLVSGRRCYSLFTDCACTRTTHTANMENNTVSRVDSLCEIMSYLIFVNRSLLFTFVARLSRVSIWTGRCEWVFGEAHMLLYFVMNSACRLCVGITMPMGPILTTSADYRHGGRGRKEGSVSQTVIDYSKI